MAEEKIYEIIADEEMEGTRIDLVLSLALPETSRSFIQKVIETGGVKIGEALCTSKKYKVAKGEVIRLEVPVPAALDIKAENLPIDIVYEDEHLLVVNKEKGMVVHPAVGNYEGTLVNAVMYHCGHSLSSINGVIRPGIVHRIDKDTSGLLVIAKNDAAHNCLAGQFAEHSIARAYQAVVYNNFTEDCGTVDAPLGRDPRNRFKRAVTTLNSKPAITHYEVLERFGKFTYIEARLETGRTHQIRVHMAHIKHPLLGDELYGPKNGPMNTAGQVLHAKLLGFVHPATGSYMEFESPLPNDFQRILDSLRAGARR